MGGCSKIQLNNGKKKLGTENFLRSERCNLQQTAYLIKEGEASSQFCLFTIAKIEIQFWNFFVIMLRLRLQRYTTKRYSP